MSVESQMARIAELDEALRITLASLVAALSLLERGGKRAAASDKIFQLMLADYHAAVEIGRAALKGESR
jgi:hypothetical protein